MGRYGWGGWGKGLTGLGYGEENGGRTDVWVRVGVHRVDANDGRLHR